MTHGKRQRAKKREKRDRVHWEKLTYVDFPLPVQKKSWWQSLTDWFKKVIHKSNG